MIQKTKNEWNKVILIGGSHHNGLGLVRSFGENGIRPYGIIVCPNQSDSFVTHSRYWEKVWVVQNEELAVEKIKQEFSGDKKKAVIIPWSDSIEFFIDQHLNELKRDFILPSINDKQGRISELMDKQKQIEFADKYDLPMARSKIVLLNNIILDETLKFPCIVKPVNSAEGSKLDIKKCLNKEELYSCFSKLKQRGYYRILVQEYINFDEELEFVGSCDNIPAWIISRNIREWPVIGGTNSFFQVINHPNVNRMVEILLDVFKKEKYTGMFDVELFRVGNKIFINEFNWRNTGNVFFVMGQVCIMQSCGIFKK